jgi:hypothetical protein
VFCFGLQIYKKKIKYKFVFRFYSS